MTLPIQDWTKLGRYLAGESAPAEAAEVRRWLDEHPAEARAIAALDVSTAHCEPAQFIDVEHALNLVKTRARPGSRTFSPWRFAGFATAAAALILAVFVTRRFNANDAADAARVYSTRVGARDSVLLADGTRMLLGPGSRAAVSENGRDVELSGQAYFRVVHDATRPFTVRAGGAVIQDAGTEFSVHSDPSQPVRVVVAEGSVRLALRSDSVILRPGDVGLAVGAGGVRASRGTATPEDLAWTRGELVFRDAPMEELAADLRRWYGVELLVVDTALQRRHFTGSFTNEPAHRVLSAIALALGARVGQRGDTAVLTMSPPTAR